MSASRKTGMVYKLHVLQVWQMKILIFRTIAGKRVHMCIAMPETGCSWR